MTPNDNSPQKPQQSDGRFKAFAVILILLFLFVGSCWFRHRQRLSGHGLEEPAAAAPTPSVQPSSTPAVATVPLPKPPNYEAYFISSVQMYQTGFPPESDQARIAYNRGERARGISNALPGIRTLDGWIGVLRKVQKTSDGKMAVAIELPQTTILLQTWDDAASDAGANTLIDPKSEVYQALAGLRAGSPVSFDFEFLESPDDWVKEGSKTVKESMLTPKFIVRFKKVTSLRP